MEYATPAGFADLKTTLEVKHGYKKGTHWKCVTEVPDASEFIEVVNPDRDGDEFRAKVKEIATVIAGIEGVALVATRQRTPSLADLGLDHALAGDIAAFAKAGHTFNFVPFVFGVHGHPLAQPNVLLVSGGHPWLAGRPNQFVGYKQPGAADPADPVGRPSVLSIAPTLAWLFGLPQMDYYANGRLPYAFNRA